MKFVNAILTKGNTLVFIGLFVVAAVIFLPSQFINKAEAQRGDSKKGLVRRTLSHEDQFPNFDIREPKADQKGESEDLLRFRQSAGKDIRAVDSIRESFVRAENELRGRIPTLKVDRNPYLNNPEVISPDPTLGRAALAAASPDRVGTLRNFLKQNNDLVGLRDDQVDDLKATADYTNPSGDLSFVRMEQTINGVPVFLGEISGAFSKDGQLFRVLNTTGPGLDEAAMANNFGDPGDAVRAAFNNVSRAITPADTQKVDALSGDLRTVFGGGDDATIAEKMYFPIEPGVARAAWRVLIWQPINAYYVIVDAETGEMLWRKNITNDQTQSATYGVYNDDNPGPLSPTTSIPGSGTQGVGIPRSTITVIGNEAPNPGQNNLGWITDGANITDGNNIEAGLDIVAPNGVDAPATGAPNRVFDFSYNPPPAGADAPSSAAYRNGVVTNLFFHSNKYHDFTYAAGFTEAARNFQNDNFGRGGAAADRVSGEAQDSSGTNNANFATPADGGRGRMQMYLFTAPSPQRDGSLDADVFIHELTHGTSNRLIGNGSGLGNSRGGSMGEGWSDFYGRMYLATAGENVNAVYAAGSYVTLNFSSLGTDNYYYGIRRFPYAVKTTVGGPSSRPHNPLTFADIDPAQINTSDGAYPKAAWIGNTANEVHNAGEVWCMMLLEVRARIIARLGFAAGNQRILQITTDGMKLTPTSPNFIQARDAIIAADQSGFGGADVADIWAGFATRGAGFGASDGGTAVVESFALPNAVMTSPFSVSDSTGDGDGFPEPGERVLLNVSVVNNTGNTVNNVTASVAGGGSNTYGNIPNGATVTRTLTYTVPAASACGSLQPVAITVASDLGSQPPVNQSFRLGVPVGGPPVTFSNTTPIVIPGTGTGPGASAPYGTAINVAGLTGNKTMKLTLNGLSHTFPGDIDMLLVGPAGQKFIVLSDAGGTTDLVNATTILHDGATTQITTTGDTNLNGEFKPVDVTAGDTFTAPAPAGPYTSAAPVGAGTFTSVMGTAGSALNGTWTLYVMDDAGADTGAMTGWSLTFEANDYACALPTASDATVSGRVLSADGRGVTNARVQLTDASGTTRTVMTGRRGMFTFDLVETGASYVVSVMSRRYRFDPQTIQVTDNVSDLIFQPSAGEFKR